MAKVHAYLQELIDASTRSDPMVFVGREREMAKVLRTAKNLPPDGPRSTTILFHGAPGSGKTALLSKIRDELIASSGNAALFYPTVPAEEPSQKTFLRLAAHLVGTDMPTRRSAEERGLRVSGNLQVARAERSTKVKMSPAEFHSVEDIVGEKKASWGPNRRVIVFVDEVHELQSGTAAASVLAELHAQGDIPVLLVLAGLGNSRIALSNAGMSRIENHMPLGQLTPEQTLGCARDSLRRVAGQGVHGTADAIERWAVAIAESSDAWPRHLQTYLQAAWEVLLDQERPDLCSANLDAALDAGHNRRVEYYEDRQAASRTHLAIVQHLHRRVSNGDALPMQEAEREIGLSVDALDPHSKEEWRLQFENSTGRCLESLLRAGVLSLNAKYECTSPIPSFASYILGKQGWDLQ